MDLVRAKWLGIYGEQLNLLKEIPSKYLYIHHEEPAGTIKEMFFKLDEIASLLLMMAKKCPDGMYEPRDGSSPYKLY